MDDRLTLARERYEAALFGGADDGLDAADRALDGVEADLAVARGRIRHARYLSAQAAGEQPAEDLTELALFERALSLYEALDDSRGAAEAQFWVGCFHQVVRGDLTGTEALFARSRDLATAARDDLTRSYALRHLAFVAQHAGRAAEARATLAESTQLRRDLGFTAGVAANLVAQAYLTAEDGRPAEASALLDEAATLATEAGAHAVAGWVSEARANLSSLPEA
ncbi:tetratricopeptide repeat protein [Asanoa sp. WMMD1127]|uniref:tetratricopeptide repeat protein n=1 Tax=Asanoa sp. WMMD1127 TaxID=3016107 RepID=UPI002417FDB5|nr:tetratricopeptide repeat protein [Asanoa sp. WMMD1127]MDG4825480.1 tetratricopeptide repeat protein [Asanoa sp. WMMD1127]